MKNKKILNRLLTLVVAVCLSLTVLGGLFAGTAQAADEPVKLYNAKLETIYSNGVLVGYYSSGKIAIQNLGATKTVTVRYAYSDGVWKDVAAKYVKTTSDGYELWSFETPKVYPSFHYYNFNCTFAVKYTVNGTTYWDNNNNSNYYVSVSNVPGTVNTPYALAKSIVLQAAAGKAQTPGTTTYSVNGSIVLKNLAYSKVVKVRYSTDNWATYKEVNATYGFTYSNNLESWSFAINNLSPTATVKYCISYTVNGVTYWDNNFGANYTL
ncbi:MAG: CBM21 domain-containing protein [Clostridia bacterium]|nr:CBM21 domain-containing protein [Clostridia bacterium]